MEPVVSLRIAKTIIGLFGLIGNSLVCLVIYRVPALRSLTNALICHQAFIDLLSCLFMLIHSNVANPSTLPSGIAGQLYCQLWDAPVIFFTLMVASTFNLMLVTLERYFAIIFPFQYLRLFSRKTNIILMIGVWIVTISYKLNDMSRYGLKNGTCITKDVKWKRGLGIVQFLIEYFIPLIIMMFAYVHIMITLRGSEVRIAPAAATVQENVPIPAVVSKGTNTEHTGESSDTSAPQQQQPQQQSIMNTLDKSLRRARRNTFKTLALVYLAFLICWTPNSFIFLLWNLGLEVDNSSVVYRITVIMAVSNSAINFVIYGFKYKQFRKGLKVTLQCDNRNVRNVTVFAELD